MAQLITGIFRDRTSAESAVDSLEHLGYKREDISVLMHDRTRMKDFADLTGTAEGGQKSSTGAKIGASIGGTLAAIVSGLIYKRRARRRPRSYGRDYDGSGIGRRAAE